MRAVIDVVTTVMRVVFLQEVVLNETPFVVWGGLLCGSLSRPAA